MAIIKYLQFREEIEINRFKALFLTNNYRIQVNN